MGKLWDSTKQGENMPNGKVDYSVYVDDELMGTISAINEQEARTKALVEMSKSFYRVSSGEIVTEGSRLRVVRE